MLLAGSWEWASSPLAAGEDAYVPRNWQCSARDRHSIQPQSSNTAAVVEGDVRANILDILGRQEAVLMVEFRYTKYTCSAA